ncbi:FtsW/RodA/SpoVE family cell cycle protein [Anoxybacillus rupiensis]|uniref:Probable peptidoglycan glycosyltransferase FtsW n=1 Tax=Anoxybacteroides rupiense TaxID=311460 RepID=A0ABD5IQW4_9BACL|nr:MULTISPECIES: FtsW/RodA/SpoVE family cell cycle protein [Anoxybacillus]KXG10416.1 putative lipid II flippase FtsW [Anoxybacillus sp. P3H1B]MBB3906300.1 cell division protein FtsW [Anoxybacillus rupiensis]MBS2770716.1 FtsW/RodA/SpoVE family cell cycle protein [Anoxybacillus rupiensis]MDE8562982.1 FtsW/RodA/SpoVE family cell cycle protein [Anoxybacillus rupiensis]MED5050357.1 FtsW/RodA/SpoVE family cell cycle protein [Anoxybacillus rupiensis]
MNKQLFKNIVKSYDYPLIIAVWMLAIFGLVMVYSSSMVAAVTRYGVASDYFFQKQKMWLAASGICFLITMLVPYKVWMGKKVIQGIFFASPILLIAVAFLGHTANNATSWFKLGFFSIQPAELVKLSLLIYLAAVFANKQKKLAEPVKGQLFPIYYTLWICFLIAIQPDFGTAMIVLLIASCVILSSGLSFRLLWKQLLFFMMVAAVVAPVSLPFIWDEIFSPERLSRFYSFVNPFKYADDEGFQLVNSYLAIGLGGLKGLGLGQSIQKYGYLPESHTDFIIAVIAEELGLFGVAFVLLLLAFIVLKGFMIARKCNDAFGSLLAIGISSMIGIQTFINVGGVTGLIPITGVPLPLVSYGGSALILFMTSLGIMVNISMFVKYEAKYKHKEQHVDHAKKPLKRGLTF